MSPSVAEEGKLLPLFDSVAAEVGKRGDKQPPILEGQIGVGTYLDMSNSLELCLRDWRNGEVRFILNGDEAHFQMDTVWQDRRVGHLQQRPGDARG
ncbi:MAG TPA: hypothetical protein VJP78_03330 [Thermoleophilia bacterium]|nr:hypothetical protein [Thermoleophilia bacterium]